MSFLSGYENDVFISYSYDDNAPGLIGEPWVTQFVGYIETSLRQRLGCGEELKVYFDCRDLSSNSVLENLLHQAKNSATFIAITSPSYVQREWTIKELEAFASVENYVDRLFVAEMLPLDAPMTYPDLLDGNSRIRYWKESGPESRVRMTITPETDLNIYTNRLLNMTDQIRKRLVQEHMLESGTLPKPTKPAPKKTAPKTTEPQDPGRVNTVLLCQSTDDLEVESEQVRSYFEQMGIRVLPSMAYSQGGEEFVASFQADLDRADMVVQLVSRSVGRMPPDLKQGYTLAQYERADQAEKPFTIWRHPEVNVEDVANSNYLNLLQDKRVITSSLESFKTEAVAMLNAFTTQPAPEEDDEDPIDSLVYINADRSDLAVAQEIQSQLQDHNIPVVMPTFEGSAEEIRLDLEENLRESDAVLMVHGNAPTTWVRGNLRRLHKIVSMRDEDPSLVAMIRTPDAETSEVGISLPYVSTIDCSEHLDVETILGKLEEAS